MKYLKQFENHTQYENYINGSGAILPNVSICTTEGDVHYNPSTPPTPLETRLVCKYNVEDTYPTQLCFSDSVSQFSAIEIDGVVQPSVVDSYTFSTAGEHTVKYTLTDPTSIGDDAFYGCGNLTSIDIPNGVTTIGSNAFQNCINLTSIVIPSGVTSIGGQAFYSSSLTRLNSDVDGVFNIPNGVTSIDYYAFNSTYPTSVTIPNSVTSIGFGAFGCCSMLDDASITAIETINPDDAFYCD